MADGPAGVMDQFIAAFEKGDLDAVCALIHPDAVVREAAGLPYSGEYRGPDGFRTLVGAMFGGYEFQLLETEYLPVDAERIVVKMDARFTSRISGNSVDFPVVEIYTIRDGTIRGIDIYYKNPGAVSALHGVG